MAEAEAPSAAAAEVDSSDDEAEARSVAESEATSAAAAEVDSSDDELPLRRPANCKRIANLLNFLQRPAGMSTNSFSLACAQGAVVLAF